MIDPGSGGTKTTTTVNVVDIFGLKFNRDAPLTYYIFLATLTIILLLLAQANGGLAVGLALTVLLAVAFSHH